MFGHGISYEGDIIDLALKGDIVQKTGSWYSFGDERIGQGRENAKNYLRDNADTMAKMISQVKAFMGLEEETEDQPEN